MSPDLSAKVEAFNAAKEAHAAAEKAFKEANDASSRAGSVRKAAADVLAKAKSDMQAAFLQEVDPMPLVPSKRPDETGFNMTFKMKDLCFPIIKTGRIA